MICSLKNVVIMVGDGSTAFLTTTSRDGEEMTILKEKPSREMFRKYYCNACKTHFDGEGVNSFDEVVSHFGKSKWHDVAESEIKDLDDPSLRPTVRKRLEMFA